MSKELPKFGKVVVAHPLRVAQADQIAKAEGITEVFLNELVPLTGVYIFDPDYITRIGEVHPED